MGRRTQSNRQVRECIKSALNALSSSLLGGVDNGGDGGDDDGSGIGGDGGDADDDGDRSIASCPDFSTVVADLAGMHPTTDRWDSKEDLLEDKTPSYLPKYNMYLQHS